MGKYRISQIKINLNETKDDIPRKIIKKIGNRDLLITNFQIVRESIDARDKRDIKLVYTVDFDAVTKQRPREIARLSLNSKTGVSLAPTIEYKDVKIGETPLKNPPVIIGFGPCGMFAGLTLARQGYKPIIIERGKAIDERRQDVEKFWNEGILNPESNVQFGEGGAGTFSDGKLTTGIKDIRTQRVLKDFVKAGAAEEIMYKHRPHIGTDVLRTVVKNIRKEIISLGGEVRFNTKFTSLIVKGRQVTGITVEGPKGEETIEAEQVILATGHSARDTFRKLFDQGVRIEQKPFSIGVRVEHDQSVIDEAQYGDTKGLPPADYKLSHHLENGRGVYTFCMCPGGEIIGAASETGRVVTNGMSNFKRDSGKANSAVLVDVKYEDFPSTHPLAGVDFQQKYEELAYINGGKNYHMPEAKWSDFRDNAKDAMPLINSLPDFAVEGIKEAMPYFGRTIKGFDDDDVRMVGIETRSSSPVRFPRNENYQGTYEGFYPSGEGAGHAGGIMSAACDGIKVAEKIIESFAPSKNKDK